MKGASTLEHLLFRYCLNAGPDAAGQKKRSLVNLKEPPGEPDRERRQRALN
jgi:hypothetical protein